MTCCILPDLVEIDGMFFVFSFGGVACKGMERLREAVFCSRLLIEFFDTCYCNISCYKMLRVMARYKTFYTTLKRGVMPWFYNENCFSLLLSWSSGGCHICRLYGDLMFQEFTGFLSMKCPIVTPWHWCFEECKTQSGQPSKIPVYRMHVFDVL